jgi:diguanylate cyclase (GGDEF)-like protein
MNPANVWSSPSLPSLPAVAVRLLELTRDPETEFPAVVETIKRDPAITAKILKATNSSFFACASKVTTIERAVLLRGTTGVTSLALSFSLVQSATARGDLAEYYQRYWRQSVVQGLAAELIGRRWGKDHECEFFLAGLLADIGQLAMLKTVGKQYGPVLARAGEERVCPLALERAELGFDHVEVGTKLMENWRLPAELAAAARLHHADPQEIDQLAGGEGGEAVDLVRAVATATAAGEYFCQPQKGTALERLRVLGGRFYAMSEADVQAFVGGVKGRVDEAADIFAVSPDQVAHPEELMAQANEHLAELVVRERVAGSLAEQRGQAAERERARLQSQNEELQRRASVDALTGVYNRRSFDEALARDVNRSARAATTVGLVFVDVDHFKKLNDTYGHPFGDEVLRQVAATLQGKLRGTDVLARYGGEEFVVLAAEPTEAGAQKLAERLRAAIAEGCYRFGQQEVTVTASVGVAVGVPQRSDDDFAARLVAAADEAMYEAKHGGRNRVAFRSLLDEETRQLTKAALQRRFSRWLVARGVLDIPAITPALPTSGQRPRLGELARQCGALDGAAADRIAAAQVENGGRFGETAVRLGLLSADQVATLLAWQAEAPERLAENLARLGLLCAAEAQALLDEYYAAAPLSPPTTAREPVVA